MLAAGGSVRRNASAIAEAEKRGARSARIVDAPTTAARPGQLIAIAAIARRRVAAPTDASHHRPRPPLRFPRHPQNF